MDPLRWIILIVGAAVMVGIYLWGRRSGRTAVRTEPERQRWEPALADEQVQTPEDRREPVFADFGEAMAEPDETAREDEWIEPEMPDATPMSPAADSHRPPIATQATAAQPAPAQPRPESAEAAPGAAPSVDTDEAERPHAARGSSAFEAAEELLPVARVEPAPTAAAAPDAVEEVVRGQQHAVLLALHLRGRQGPLPAAEVGAAARGLGLNFDADGHGVLLYRDDHPRVVYRLAPTVRIDEEGTDARTLTLYAEVSEPARGRDSLRHMVHTGRRLAELLDALLLDGLGRPLTDGTIARLERRLDELTGKRD